MNNSIVNIDNILNSKNNFTKAYESGLSRRDFLKLPATSSLLAGIMHTKPIFAKLKSTQNTFNKHQNKTMLAVQQILFPNDGDGPSAYDLNALRYLHWALSDPDNIADGDPAYLIKGLVSLDVFTEDLNAKKFIDLSINQQNTALEQIQLSDFGENWLSLIIYYLLEALLLDPAYGGNPDGIGWKWLEHQAGFPLPSKENSYINYMFNYET